MESCCCCWDAKHSSLMELGKARALAWSAPAWGFSQLGSLAGWLRVQPTASSLPEIGNETLMNRLGAPMQISTYTHQATSIASAPVIEAFRACCSARKEEPRSKVSVDHCLDKTSITLRTQREVLKKQKIRNGFRCSSSMKFLYAVRQLLQQHEAKADCRFPAFKKHWYLNPVVEACTTESGPCLLPESHIRPAFTYIFGYIVYSNGVYAHIEV